MESELTAKLEFILPRILKSGLSLLSWQWLVVFGVFCFALLGLAGADSFGEGILSGMFVLFLLWVMAINYIDIEEYDKPELFIGVQGFRFGQKGMPEIPWSEVTAVEFNEAMSSGQGMNAKVIIKTKDDARWFPKGTGWQRFLLRVSLKYEWPKVGLELAYDQARVFAVLAQIRTGLAEATMDAEFNQALRENYRLSDGAVINPVDIADIADIADIDQGSQSLPPGKSQSLPDDTRRCYECKTGSMKAVDHVRGGYSSDYLYECTSCGHKTTIDVAGVPYLSGIIALMVLIAGIILGWHVIILFFSGIWVLRFGIILYDDVWKYPQR